MKKSKIAISILVAAAATAAGWAFAHVGSACKDELQTIADAYLKDQHQAEGFTGLSASVYVPFNKNNGGEVLTVVAGTRGYPPYTQFIAPDDLFQIGSITKSFVAVIILQLQAEGKLKLDDPIGKFLPQYPNWSTVTIRQLLNMTSAIPNYSADPAFEKLLYGQPDKVWDYESLLTYAHPDKPLAVKPGSLWDYSNSNYILAAMIIEKITGEPFNRQMHQRLLKGANELGHTYYPDGKKAEAIQNSLMGQMVHGYYFNAQTKKWDDVTRNNLSWAGPAGAIIADTENVLHWVRGLYKGEYFSDKSRENAMADLEEIVSMQTGQALDDVSAENPRGFGLGVGYVYDPKSKQRFWFYEGSTLGYRVMYLWKACNNVTVVAALNSKGGEGDANAKIPDNIHTLALDLYQTVVDHNPELQCDD